MPRKKSIFTGDLKKEGVESKKDEFLEDEEHEESSEDVEQEMHTGKKEADVYTQEGREELVEEDGISDWEEGFSEGAEEKGELGNCATCGKVLSQQKDKVVEKEVNHELLWFCSNKCAEEYKG